jgi:phospholipid N-methyltransferase
MQLLRSFLVHPRQVGSIVPTGHRAVNATLDLADVPQAQLVVELGAGTGVFTVELLRRLGPSAQVLAFEIDRSLAGELSARFDDDRLAVIAESATKLLEHLDNRRAEIIVSALPFTSLPAPLRSELLHAITRALAPGGTLLAIQYSTARARELAGWFGSIERRFVVANVPPAFLFACRSPRPR